MMEQSQRCDSVPRALLVSSGCTTYNKNEQQQAPKICLIVDQVDEDDLEGL